MKHRLEASWSCLEPLEQCPRVKHQAQETRAKITSTILPPPLLTFYFSKHFSAASELEPFLHFSRHPQGILSLALKRKVNMIRSKAQVTGQHTTTVFAPVKHKYTTPKACPAEIIGPLAPEVGTTFPNLLCIPGRCSGQSVKSQDKTAPEGPQQGSLQDGLKHKSEKHILVCSAFAIHGEPRVVCCCQCLQGTAPGPSEWTGHHSPHCTSLCPIPTCGACWSEQDQAWQDQDIRENLSSSYPLNAVGETCPLAVHATPSV